jgi:NhaA family Na+:H+ antiporter
MSGAPENPRHPATERPPPGAWAPARQAALRLVRPLERFLKIQAASGIVLLIAAVIAMTWANSPWQHSYEALWHTPISFGVGGAVFRKDLHFWINDGLMVIFFFVVGLEIRREIHAGELSDLKRAALPIAAALGGMLVPALIYLSFNTSRLTHHGWGVPMATDIAFAVGILTLLGKRVPAALRVLLLALAIIDDIGAILVIAFFYSAGVKVIGLLIAAAGVAGVLGMQRFGVRQAMAYVVPGTVLWIGMMVAGVHPTIAGVILGLLTPARSWFGEEGFLHEAGDALSEFRHRAQNAALDKHALVNPLARLDKASREALPPVVRLEAQLNPWVAYGIMPLFALANAGVTVGQVHLGQEGTSAIAVGVALGLLIGKPIGIVAASLLSVKLGLCALPRGVDWRGLLVVGAVGGIGFTMALFIAQLAFHDATQLGVAKLAILVGSLAAGIGGMILGRALLSKTGVAGAARTVTEAETSTDL